MPARSDGKLTPKEARFVEEYIKDLNGAAALRRTGTKAKSVETQCVIANELLKKPRVRAALDVAQQRRTNESGITADLVLRRLRDIAFSDGLLGLVQVKASDMNNALAQLGKHLGLAKDGSERIASALETLSDDQLNARLKSLQAQVK